MSFSVRDTSRGAQFAVRVQPRASRTAVAGVMGDAVKIAITAPPVDGKANQAVIEFLAERLRVPKSNVEIVSGETGRNKLVAVRGVSAEAVRAALGV
jgi:uncharacterized protein (TIGR00251 family)